MSQGLFSVSVVSLPLNFTILLHPNSMASLGIEENGYALVKGINGLITVVKVIKDQDCPETGTRITHSVQMTLGASPGDSVPILPFSGNEHCEAIQIAPLFDKNSMSNESSDFTTAVKHYFQSDSRPISVDSIFTLMIDSEERAFKILKCSPTDRSFSSKSTKLYFTAEPGPLLPKPLISKHLNTLVLDKNIVNFVKNNIYYPANKQSILRSLNIPTSNGILIEGPPGSGKTSLLSAISNTINIPSIYCQSKRLKKLSVSDYVEKLNQVFGYTAEKPQCLIMFDDIDYILNTFQQSTLTSDRIKLATFFNLLDAVMSRGGIIVIATATSPLVGIDPALLRDGRFGQRIVLNQPTIDQRKELIRLYTGGMRVEDDDLNEIVKKIGGKGGEINSPITVSAKEIERICRVAVTSLIEEATGNTGTEVVDSLAVYTLNTKMKAMHFGVTSASHGRMRPRDRGRFDDDENEDDDDEGRGSHRRRRRRHHHHRDGEEDDDEDGSRRRHRHHRRRHHQDDEDEDEDGNEEDEDDGQSRRRRRHRHGDSGSSRRRRHHSSRRNRYEDNEEEEETNNNNNRRNQRKRNVFAVDDDDEEEEDDGRRNRGGRRRGNAAPFPQRQRRNVFQDDVAEEEDEDAFSKRARNRRQNRNDDNQDPFNRNRKSPFQNRSSRRNNNDDDEENDDDDDQLDRRNRSQQRRQPPSRGRNNFDDELDDDDTDNRKRGSRSSRRNGGRNFAEDDEDDNRNSRRRSNRSNRRRDVDEENEDDQDDERAKRSRQVFQDDEDDEENFPPRKRNK